MTVPEDLFEEALRSDLPSPDTEARLRRRLMAAGLALGNGVATTTAAATGSAAASSGASAIAKVMGLSWGIKLGLAAAVGIPSVGLWLDNTRGRSELATRSTADAVPSSPSSKLSELSLPPSSAPASGAVGLSAGPEASAAPRFAARAGAPLASPALVLDEPSRSVATPSQSEFAPAAEALGGEAEAGSSLAEETRLLDAAFAQLAAGDYSRAAKLLSEHEARYPDGRLQRERERARRRISELSRGQ